MVNLVGFALGLSQARQADVPREDAARFGLLGAAAPSPLMGAVVVSAALAQQQGRGLLRSQRDGVGASRAGAAGRRRELERQLRQVEQQFAAQEQQEAQRREEEREQREERRRAGEEALQRVVGAFAAYEQALARQEDGDPPPDVDAARREFTEALIGLQANVVGDQRAQQAPQAEDAG